MLKPDPPDRPVRTLPTNEYLQSILPNIYAAGDVAGPYQFTHVAAHQAWYAAVNALFGRFRMFKADYRVIPWATFIDPEVAEYVLAMKHGLGLNKILGTIHTYPTMSEANKYVAGAWKRAHQPHRLLAWVARYHAWQRG